MKRMYAIVVGAIALVAVLATVPGGAATISPARFSGAKRLGPWAGAEPSIAFDPNGAWVYVVAPQGGPSGIGTAINPVVDLGCSTILDCTLPSSGVRSGERGVGFWASYDGGRNFGLSKVIGSGVGGWDSDVVVAPDHTVYVADLEVASTAICASTTRGQSFSDVGTAPDTCNTLPLGHHGPSNDRAWLSVGKRGELYLTYHEFTTGFPIILSSTDKGKTFTPCGSILDPNSVAGKNYSPLAGTLVAKPVVGKDGSIFVTVTEPNTANSPLGGALSQLYIGVGRGGCAADKVFENYKIYSNPGADFTLFNSLAMDGAGVLYAVAAGKTAAGQTSDSTWLFVSRTGGRTWSAPIKVNPPSIRGNVMPAVVGGLRGNQVAIAWFGTPTSGNPGYAKNQWRYYVATSFDGGRRFLHSTVTPSPVHYGGICTQGVVCDPTGEDPAGNRNLLDFASITINPRTGCLAVAFPGDPWNRPDLDPERNDLYSSAYVSTQTSGNCLR